jgi:HEAT repeat protein
VRITKKGLVRGLVLGVILIALGGLIFVLLPDEPAYEGKTLSYWFAMSCRQSDYWSEKEALGALQKIGTNAVPYLLKEALNDKASTAKGRFIQFLDYIESFRVVDHLVHSLNLPRPPEAENKIRHAMLALREIKPPARQLLLWLQGPLNSTNLFERNQALFILGAVGDGAEEAVPDLRAALKISNRYARAIAIQSLGQLGPRAQAAVPSLIEVLKEPRGIWYSGIRAAFSLGKIGNAAAPAIPKIRELFESETNWSTQCGLAAALLCISPKQVDAMAFLTNSLASHLLANDRWVAARELGEIGPSARAAVPALIQALDGTNNMLTCEIADALRKIEPHTDAYLPQLKTILQSHDEPTRVNTAARIMDINPADHEAHLVLMSEIRNGGLEIEFAMNVLGSAGAAADEAIPVLREAAKNGQDQEIRRTASRALERMELKPAGNQ